MKNIFLLTSLIFSLTATAQLDYKLRLEDFQLQGNVSKVVERSYRIDQHKELKKDSDYYTRRVKDWDSMVYVFNDNGLITESITYPNLVNRTRTLYFYDDQNRIIQLKESETDKNQEFSRFADVLFTYSNDTMYTNATISDANKLGYKKYISVLKNGLVVWYQRVESNFDDTYELVYDDKRKLKLKRTYTEGKLRHEMNYEENLVDFKMEYFPNGLVKKIVYDNSIHTFQYIYDENNNWIVKTIFEDDVARETFVRAIGY